MLFSLIMLLKVCPIMSVKLDLLDCGVDNEPTVVEGLLDVAEYPWLGILYYEFFGEDGDTRSVTTVALIHREFVIGAAADIGPMPKKDFRKKTRVLLGEDWTFPGRRVRNYIIHPEYGETYNTVCLVQLKDDVKNLTVAAWFAPLVGSYNTLGTERSDVLYSKAATTRQYSFNATIRPLCPPPNILKNPEFYVIKVKYDADTIQKQVIKVVHIPGKMCKDFYVAANLYSKMMRPPHVTCAVEIKTKDVCVWSAGAALVSRDVWGRWQLLGVGVRGPGCGAPSRYLDMMSYYPWIEDSLSKFRELTISKINNHKYVLRHYSTETSGGIAPELTGKRLFQRFGACDPEEKENLLYRDVLSLRTDNENEQSVKYNLTIHANVEYTCLTLELINASATSEMRVTHQCDRVQGGPNCYKFKSSEFDISVLITFGDTCLFELAAWGHLKVMHLINVHEWKWREGEYYPDFNMQKVEYRGTSDMTGFGFEPLDRGEWVPEYDLWTTTIRQEPCTTVPPSYLPEKARIYTTRKRKKPPKYRNVFQKQIRPYCLFWHICWHQNI